MESITSMFGWSIFGLALVAAAALAVVAWFVPRPPLFWASAGALAVAVTAAAAPLAEAPSPVAPVIALLGVAVAVFGGGPAATTALQLAMGGSAVPGLHGGIIVADSKAEAVPGVLPARREVLRGGTTIGVLERLASAGTIVAGFPEGLAIVVAVKGVGRFTELEAPEARERFIIGTLASLVWACAAGLAVHLAIR